MAIRSTVRVLDVLVHRRTLRRHDQWTPEQLRAHQDRMVSNHQVNTLRSTADGSLWRWSGRSRADLAPGVGEGAVLMLEMWTARPT